MQNRRLFFSVIIKLLVFLGLLLLTLVFLNSLFTNDSSNSKVAKVEKPLTIIDISEMQSGQIRKARWKNREVAILFRQFPENLDQAVKVNELTDLHPSIKTHTRSKKPEYFVYFNVGDSKNCPLYYAGGIFKDVCSSNRFDEAGRYVNGNLQSYMLEIPAHYFEHDKLIIGKWLP